VPARSGYIMGNVASSPPTPGQYAGGDWKNAQVDLIVGRIIEDARGFGPVGNPIASGSNTPTLRDDQSDPHVGASYTHESFTSAISTAYAKSVRNNPEYAPNADETFTVPVNTPFLIEKAVFEIPVAVGPGWFADQTQCFMPVGSDSPTLQGLR